MDRNTFITTIWRAKRVKALTPNAYLIGRVLLRRVNKRGQCWPSRDTLAEDVGCSTRTVARALVQLRELGVLSWQQRRRAWNRRDSNLYALSTERKKEVFDTTPKPKCPPAPLTPDEAAALERLAAIMGCSPAEAMPWLVGELDRVGQDDPGRAVI